MDEKLTVKLIKGFVIGASMLIPGVSGGTMAIILNIYDDLIHATSSFLKDIKGNGIMLLQYGLSGLCGVVLMSGFMLSLLKRFEMPMMFFFMGAILGSVPPLYKKATISKLKVSNILVGIIGVLIGGLLMFLPSGMFAFKVDMSFHSLAILFVTGIVIAVALILPGISASYVLLMLGIYNAALVAIRTADMAFLAPIAVGTIVGIFLTAGILDKSMKRHPQFTYMIIIGFMLGSLLQVFPGLPGGLDIVFSATAFLVGLGLILKISR